VIGVPFKLKGDGYAEFATEGTRFAVYERARLPELIGRSADAGDPAAEIVFVVDDVDAWPERLARAGTEMLKGPLDRPWGHRTLHFLDPDGHLVELAQEIARTDRP
jgi:lactoylglutathione lyase